MIRKFIAWAARRTLYENRMQVVTYFDDPLFKRFSFLWPDEVVLIRANGDRTHRHRPPWWRPFNVMLHCWRPISGTEEAFHDHPRWTITVLLKGCIIERTPWGERTLRPGSVVIRSRKAIHAFKLPDGHRGKTWTLFIVGRRDHAQNSYDVIPRGRSQFVESRDRPERCAACPLRKS